MLFFIESVEMTKTSSKATSKALSKSVPKPSAPNNPETDTDDDDIFEGGDFVSLSESLEEETVKRDSRRKIEIYWEKKRLKEQFDDFDESEFGF
jgi:hypothetical protein